MIYGLVYCVTHVISGKRYVGQTFSRRYQDARDRLLYRKKRHERSARSGSALPFHCAIRKYGPSGFHWEIIKEASSREVLNDLERSCIEAFGSLVGKHGYNATSSGSVFLPSTHTREKMAQSAKARWSRLTDAERSALTEKLKYGRDSTPGLREMYSALGKSVLQRPEVRANRDASLRAARQTPRSRQLTAQRSREMWAAKTPEERAAIAGRRWESRRRNLDIANRKSAAA